MCLYVYKHDNYGIVCSFYITLYDFKKKKKNAPTNPENFKRVYQKQEYHFDQPNSNS